MADPGAMLRTLVARHFKRPNQGTAMDSLRTPPVPNPHRGLPRSIERRNVRVVEMRGEYDLCTVASLCEMLSAAIAVDDADLVVDASEVTFLNASTISVLIRARIFLRDHSRSLLVRSPSPCVRRIFDICDLDELLEPTDDQPAARHQAAAGALETWVAVPPATPEDHPSSSSADETPSRVVASGAYDFEDNWRSALIGVLAPRTEPREGAPTPVRP